MDFYTGVVTFFRDGGFFLYPMAMIFAVGVSIAIERTIVLTRASASNRGIWEKVGAPYEIAQARLLLGLAYRGEGDEDGAREELTAASWPSPRWQPPQLPCR